MAGSLTWRQYSSDNGAVYSVRVDKSNASATVSGGTGALMPVRTVNSAGAPQALKKRYANTFNRANPLQKRRFYIGTTANFLAASNAGATITAEDYPVAQGAAGVAQTWVVTSVRGERANLPPAFGASDSGLTDGTATQ